MSRLIDKAMAGSAATKLEMLSKAPDPEDILNESIEDFSNALFYLNRSVKAIRLLVPSAANGLANKVNNVSDCFMDAIAEAQRPPSPLPPPAHAPAERPPATDLSAAYGDQERLGKGPAVPPGYEPWGFGVLVMKRPIGMSPSDTLPKAPFVPGGLQQRARLDYQTPLAEFEHMTGPSTATDTTTATVPSGTATPAPPKDKGKGKAKELVIATGSGHGGTTGPWSPTPADGFPDDVVGGGGFLTIGGSEPPSSAMQEGASWARVAALTETDRNKIVPSRGVVLPVGPSPTPPSKQADANNNRVIWLSPLPDTEPPVNLKRISETLAHCGALHSIRFFPGTQPLASGSTILTEPIPRPGSCQIIFHEAKSVDNLKHTPPSSFPYSGLVHAGTPFTDMWINALDAGARRRLIIVRRALLHPVGTITIEHLVATIEQLAGNKEDVEDVVVYNVGNIAVTLASVEIAAAVKTGLERLVQGPKMRGEWDGAQIGFSRDPCESALAHENLAGKAIFTTAAGRIGSVWRGGGVVGRGRGFRGGIGAGGPGRYMRGGGRWTTR